MSKHKPTPRGWRAGMDHPHYLPPVESGTPQQRSRSAQRTSDFIASERAKAEARRHEQDRHEQDRDG